MVENLNGFQRENDKRAKLRAEVSQAEAALKGFESAPEDNIDVIFSLNYMIGKHSEELIDKLQSEGEPDMYRSFLETIREAESNLMHRIVERFNMYLTSESIISLRKRAGYDSYVKIIKQQILPRLRSHAENGKVEEIEALLSRTEALIDSF